MASKETVTIERDDTGEVVCTSPCDKNVPADARYRIGGHRPSPSFTLAAPASGRADLHVKPGSKAGFWTGVGGVTLGTLLIGAGVGTLIYGYENQNAVVGGDGETTDNSYTDMMSLGTGLVLGGVFVGLGGAVFLVSNASTSVWGHMQTGTASRDALPRVQPAVRAAALPRPTVVSIFSGTF